jgi:hypothetical protein
MLYNMFLCKMHIFRLIGCFLTVTRFYGLQKKVSTIWRRNNKKFTLESIKEKNL